VRVGDLVRRTEKYKYITVSQTGIILVVDIDMVKVSNHGWWSKHLTEVISESR